MEITGKIKLIDQTKEVGSSGFKKRDVVITTDEQYPQHILIQFVQDKCDVLNSYNLGDEVTIGINLKGREWVNPKGETVYFNTIQGWKISKVGTSQEPQSAVNQYQAAASQYPDAPKDSPFGLNNNLPTNTSPAEFSNGEGEDDLPF